MKNTFKISNKMTLFVFYKWGYMYTVSILCYVRFQKQKKEIIRKEIKIKEQIIVQFLQWT